MSTPTAKGTDLGWPLLGHEDINVGYALAEVNLVAMAQLARVALPNPLL